MNAFSPLTVVVVVVFLHLIELFPELLMNLPNVFVPVGLPGLR